MRPRYSYPPQQVLMQQPAAYYALPYGLPPHHEAANPGSGTSSSQGTTNNLSDPSMAPLAMLSLGSTIHHAATSSFTASSNPGSASVSVPASNPHTNVASPAPDHKGQGQRPHSQGKSQTEQQPSAHTNVSYHSQGHLTRPLSAIPLLHEHPSMLRVDSAPPVWMYPTPGHVPLYNGHVHSPTYPYFYSVPPAHYCYPPLPPQFQVPAQQSQQYTNPYAVGGKAAFFYGNPMQQQPQYGQGQGQGKSAERR